MDQKTSVLIESQVPGFVREEYPVFIDFLKAYYEFLENQQGSQLNDVTNQIYKLSQIYDVDLSVDEFTEQFLNTFAKYFPISGDIDAAFLIKNILPFYKAKGSEQSFKLLFKMLFGQSVDVIYPRDNVLIASGGKWQIDNSLKISPDISSVYVGDGETTEFNILKCVCPITSEVLYRRLDVYINGVLQTNEVDYYLLSGYYKIVFTVPPAEDANIEIFYENLDISLLVNRKIIGMESGASVISERITTRILNGRIIYEIFVDSKNLIGTFKVGEQLSTNVFINDTLVEVVLNSISELKEIVIVNPGSNYNVGELVNIKSPDSAVPPKAFISKVFKGGIQSISIIDGGAGFNFGNSIYVNGYGPPFADITINSLSTESVFPVFTANSFTIYSDVISSLDIANTTIDAADYGFDSTANANTLISSALSSNTFSNIGQILGLEITGVTLTITSPPVIKADPAKLIVSNTLITIDSFGSLGKLEIVSQGSGYAVGDELVFTNDPDNWGWGAFGEVTEVDGTGKLLKVDFVPDKISGTANVVANSVIVTGSSTKFDTELSIGSEIRINNEVRTVDSIASNTSLNVSSAFVSTANNKAIRLYGTTLLGGQGYEQDKLPTVTISSSTGANGVVEAVCIFGSGDEYFTTYENLAYGAIEQITIISHGEKIITIPEIDLTTTGDGTAIATPILVGSFEVFPGRWINDDGLLSAYAIRLQDRDYYNKYSYVLSSNIEFSKYKEIIKNLLHPAGMKLYAELKMSDQIENPETTLESEITVV